MIVTALVKAWCSLLAHQIDVFHGFDAENKGAFPSGNTALQIEGLLNRASLRRRVVNLRVDVKEVEEGLGHSVLNSVDAICYRIRHQARGVGFLTGKDFLPRVVDDFFLYVDGEEIVLFVAVAETEEDSGDRTLLCQLV